MNEVCLLNYKLSGIQSWKTNACQVLPETQGPVAAVPRRGSDNPKAWERQSQSMEARGLGNR